MEPYLNLAIKHHVILRGLLYGSWLHKLMKNNSNRLPFLSGMFSIMLMLSACGGGSGEPETTGGNSGGENTTTDPEGTAVTTEGGDDGTTTDNGPAEVKEGSPVTASVEFDNYNLYQVPSGSQVVLDVNSGSATLFLYNSLELESENLLCSSRVGFGESACTATVDDGELYALVYGVSAANFTISATTDCSVPAINAWVDRNMRDYYLYSNNVPSVNPSSYDSPEALIDALRFDSLDPYSYVGNAQSQSDFSEQGITKSLGLYWLRDAAGDPRIALVYENSPFGRAGIKRGDIIVAVNGELWGDLNPERYFELIGTNENPLSTTWTFIDNDSGERKNIVAQLEEFTVNTVLHSQVITHPDYSGKIGYIAFKSFIETSEGELDSTFSWFKDAGVTDLILDLRYNGGGRIRIADLLASKIAGPLTDDELFVTYQYNSRHTDKNFSRYFAAESDALGLSRLVAITTGSTASSSELVINSLRPYIDVITFGSRTEGKSFISTANTFCGKSLNAMEAEGVNKSGVGVAGGIPADCFAADDLANDFGLNTTTSIMEGMLLSAADYLVEGSCDAAPLAKRQSAEVFASQNEPGVSERAN